jgi:hypothetical protein
VIAREASGAAVRYTVGPNPAASIQPDEMAGAVVRVFQLLVELREPAKQRLGSVAAFPAAYGANYVKGELVGVGPLTGEFASREEAMAVANEVVGGASFVPYDERREERVRKQMLNEGGHKL